MTVSRAAVRLGVPRTSLARFLTTGVLPRSQPDLARRAEALFRSVGEEGEHMITAKVLDQDALDSWGLTRQPFARPASAEEVLTIRSREKAEKRILQAVDTGGWLALIGEIGAGKTTVVRRVRDKLERRGGVIVASPPAMAVPRITAHGLVYTLSKNLVPESPVPSSLLAAATALGQQLTAARGGGLQVVILIDEAHHLRNDGLLALKRLHEIDDVFARLLAIVLVGQPSLARRLRTDLTLLEVGQRADLYELPDLGREVHTYLTERMRRAGVEREVFDAGARTAIMQRCATPLAIDCLAALALQTLSDYSEEGVREKLVTKEVIASVYPVVQ